MFAERPTKNKFCYLSIVAADLNLRYLKYVFALPPTCSFLSRKNMSQIRILTQATCFDSTKDKSAQKKISALKYSRRSIKTGICCLKGYSLIKESLLFPNIENGNVHVNNPKEWKRVLVRMALKKLTIRCDEINKLLPDDDDDTETMKALNYLNYPLLRRSLFRISRQVPRRQGLKKIEIIGKFSEKLINVINSIGVLLELFNGSVSTNLIVEEPVDTVTNVSMLHKTFFKVLDTCDYYGNSQNFFLKTLLNHQYCIPNLKHLGLTVNHMYRYSPEISFLSSLQSLSNLETLSIDISPSEKALRSFLETFSLPRNITAIHFGLTSYTWKSIIPLKEKEKDPYETLDVFKNFLKQWGGLTSLRSLSLHIKVMYYIKPNLFLQAIVKRLRNLEKITINFDDEELDGRDRKNIEERTFQLGTLFSILADRSPRIKQINIKASVITLDGFDVPYSKIFDFEKVSLTGRVIGAHTLKPLVQGITDSEDSSVSISHFPIKELQQLKTEFIYLLLVPMKIRSDILYQCEGLNKEQVIEMIMFYLNEMTERANISLEIDSSFDFDKEELAMIGNLLQNKLTLRNFDFVGNNYALHFSRVSRSYRIGEIIREDLELDDDYSD